MIHQVREAVRALTAGRVVIECGGIPHKFEDVPLSKLFDGLRVASSIFARAVRPWGLPTHLQIEPTNACNLRCAVCPVTEGLNRPAGFMDFDLYRRLLDEVGESVFLILLWDWGEPFLHPRICELISYAKGKGIQFISSTNGRPFAQPGLSERVVRSGLDTLIFSIDGIRQDTYERFRGRGTLEVALEGLRSVAGAKRALNSRLPLVSLSFIVTRHNEHEVSELPSFARSLGVDALTLKTLNPYSGGPSPDGGESEFVPLDARFQRFSYRNGRRVRVRWNPCKNLWTCPAILWDGTVVPCCYDSRQEYALGSLREKTFREIWNGERYRLMRRRFAKDYRKIPICANCSLAFAGGNTAKDCIVQAEFLSA